MDPSGFYREHWNVSFSFWFWFFPIETLYYEIETLENQDYYKRNISFVIFLIDMIAAAAAAAGVVRLSLTRLAKGNARFL